MKRTGTTVAGICLPFDGRAMPEIHVLFLAACMLLGAALYTSVGHAGASALHRFNGALWRCASRHAAYRLGAQHLVRGLHIQSGTSGLCWLPLARASAYAISADAIRPSLADSIKLPGAYYRPIVGTMLLLSAAQLLWATQLGNPTSLGTIRQYGAVSYIWRRYRLSIRPYSYGQRHIPFPLLLFLGWSDTRAASGVAAVFILCNSIAGLLGNVALVKALPPDLWIYAIAVGFVSVIGTTLGIQWRPPMILKALGVVLLVAGLKLIGVY